MTGDYKKINDIKGNIFTHCFKTNTIACNELYFWSIPAYPFWIKIENRCLPVPLSRVYDKMFQWSYGKMYQGDNEGYIKAKT